MIDESDPHPPARSLDELLEIRQRYHGKTDEELREWLRQYQLTAEEVALLSNAAKRKRTAIGKEIPLFPMDVAAIPTELARTALFKVRQRGPRKVCMWEMLASRGDIQIEYFGMELDNGIDQELWLLALSIARGMKTGTRIWVTQKGLLRELGRSTGGQAKRNLKLALDRLASATLRIQFQRGENHYKFTTSLLNWGIEEETGRMFIRVDPDGQALFENLSYLDFELHLALEGGVTKALHLYAISHTRGQQHRQSLAHLKEWFGYEGQYRDFRNAILEAMQQLEENGILSDGAIQKGRGHETATWILNNQK